MLNLLLTYGWASSPGRLAIAGAVTLGFALLARVLRGVDRSGMFAGGAACFLLFAGAGPSAFAVLASLFLLTWVATRFGYRRKQDLGVAERGDGRDAWQVLANLAVASLGSVAFGVTGNHAWLFAAAAALAEAATDTVASEIGQTRGHTAVLITTWKPVAAGTDGGITIAGTIAGLAAGVLIALVAAGGGIISRAQFWIPTAAGFVGMLLDSVLGATLQRGGRMNNEAVNFFGTLAAAALAYGISS
ncbi:MAG TPA: DUF92 domain-containing protein [Terriglobales bacterium]